MRVALTFLVFVLSATCFAQRQYVGLSTGVSNADVAATSFFEDSKHRRGLHFGVIYERYFNDRIGIETGLRYIQKGFREVSIFTNDEGDIIGESDEFEFDYDYLSLPIMAEISTGNRLRGILKAGLHSSIVLNATTTTPEIEGLAGETIDVSDRVTSFDFAAAFGAEANYGVLDGLLAFTTVDYVHSLSNFSNEQYFNGREASHFTFLFSAGIKLELNSKALIKTTE